MRKRFSIALALVCALSVSCASAAYAAETLKTAPAPLQSVGFESIGDSLTVYRFDLGDSTPATATWGLSSARHQTGSYGFWCAGSLPGQFPTYPSPTRGQAVFTVADTSSYYQSWIQYSYIEPSYGALEIINPFRVDWIDASSSPTSSLPAANYGNPFLPITPVWTTVTLPRVPTAANVHATAGYFRFNFFTSANDTATAEGASIDDVASTGYKFGPAGNVSATRGASPHSSVTVSWTPAWTAASTPAPDYLVWRHDVAANTWAQVTPTRIAGTTCTDTGASVNRVYEYAVQAWDGMVSTANWGPSALSPQLPLAPATTLTGAFDGSQTTTTAPYGKKLRVTGTLSDVDGLAVGGLAGSMVVQTSPDNSTWTTAGPAVASTVVETSTGSYTATLTITTPIYCRLAFAGGSGYSASTGSPGLHVLLRSAASSWSGMGAAPATPKYNATTTFSGTLGSETGSLPARGGLIALQSSPDNSSWTTVTASIAENSSSVYSVLMTIRQNAYYRFVYLGELNYTSSVSPSILINYAQNTSVSFDTPVVSNTTPPYGSTITIGANLRSETGSVTARANVAVQSYLYAAQNGSTPAAEDAPGHYIATVGPITTTAPYALNYRMAFPGDAQYGASPTSLGYTDYVIARPANVGFQNVTAVPALVSYGGPSTISADLISETGAAVRSADASVSLVQSADNVTWSTYASALVDSATAGHYAVAVPSVTAHRYFRFRVSSNSPAKFAVPSANTTSTAAEVTCTVSPITSLTGTFDGSQTTTTAPYGKKLRVSGVLLDAGSQPLGGMASSVAVQTSPDNSTWTTASPAVASSVVETSTGAYTATLTVNAGVYCRLRFGGTGVYSASSSAPGLQVTLRSATTSWAGTGATPATPKYNSTTTLSGTLQSETGPMTGRAGLVALQSSPDNNTWTTVAASITETSSSVYAVGLTIKQPAYYRFVYLGELNYTSATSPGVLVNFAQNTNVSFGTPTDSTQTPAHGGAVTVGASLGSETGAVTGRTNVVVQTWLSGVNTSSTPATEDTPGHYSATFANITNTTPSALAYVFAFAGDPQYAAATSANSPWVTARPATIGFSNVTASPPVVLFGGASTISADLLAETSAPIRSADASVGLVQSADNATWSTYASALVDSATAGHYAVAVPSVTSHRYFRFVVTSKSPAKYAVPSANATSAAAEVTSTASPATTISGTFANGTTSPLDVSYGTVVPITGTLRDSGGVAVFGHPADVVVQTSVDGVSSWTSAGPSVAGSTVESITSPGSYQVPVTVTSFAATYYRLSFGGSGALLPSVSAPALSITGHQAPTSWTAPALSAASVPFGGAASVVATLSTTAGTVAGRASGIAVQSSPDGSAWTTVTATLTETAPGRYSAALAPLTSSRYYRLRFAGETALAASDSAQSAQLSVVAASVAWSYVATATTFPYGGQAVVSGSLASTSPLTGQAASVTLQQSANGTTGWTTAGATITEDAPAHYAAALSPAGQGAFYRLVYSGVSGQLASATSPVVAVTSTAVPTGWTGEHASVTSVPYGGTSTLSATLQYTGPIPAQATRITLLSSTDNLTWAAETASVTEPSGGTYSATLPAQTTPGTRYYRFRFAGETGKYAASDSASIQITVGKLAAHWANLGNTITALNAGIDPFELWGDLKDSGGAALGGTVAVRTSPASDGTTWSDATATVTQSPAGHFDAKISSISTDTLVELVFVGDATHESVASTAVVVTVSTPPLLFGSSGMVPVSLAWGATSVIHGTVTRAGSATADLGDSTIVLQTSFDNGAHYATVPRTPSSDGLGTFSATTPPVIVRTYFRLHSNVTASNPAFDTPWYAVMPTTKLAVPSTPSKVTHNKNFAVTGTVSGIPFAVRVVTLRAEHKETVVVKKKKTTVWVVRSTVTVRVAASSSGAASYKVNVKLKQTGSWRVRAFVSDVYSTPMTTAYRSFAAK